MPVYPSDRYAQPQRQLYIVHFTAFHARPVITCATSEGDAAYIGAMRVGTVACVEPLTCDAMYEHFQSGETITYISDVEDEF